MVGAGGGEVALRITEEQKTKNKKAKQLPVDRVIHSREGRPKSGVRVCLVFCVFNFVTFF